MESSVLHLYVLLTRLVNAIFGIKRKRQNISSRIKQTELLATYSTFFSIFFVGLLPFLLAPKLINTSKNPNPNKIPANVL